MDTIQDTLNLQWMIIFQDQREYNVKIKAINRLIDACSNTTQSFFTKWRENVQQLKIEQSMDNEKKTLAVEMFKRVIDGS